MATFPDVHHKMSKKIAQLTKVIYHLNTKNDDNEFQMKMLVGLYEKEISDVIADAKRKILAFKDQLDSKAGEERYQAAMRQMEIAHKREKEEAMKEFAAFKQESLASEASIRKGAEAHVKALTTEVNAAKEDFQRRLKVFQEVQMGLECKGADAVEELRKQKNAEIEDTVQEYNERYKAMLAEQLKLQEELERDLNATWSEKLERLRQESSQRQDRLGQQLDAERARIRELEAELKREIARSEKAAGEAGAASAAIKKLEDNELVLNEQISATLNQLAQAEQLARQRGEELASTQNRLAQSQEAESRLTDRIAQLERDLASLSGEGSELSERLQLLQAQLSAASTEVDRLGADLNEERKDAAALREQLSVTECQLREGTAHAAELQEKLAASEAALEALRQSAREAAAEAERRLRELQAEADRTAKAAAERIAGMEKEMEALKASSSDQQRSILADMQQRLRDQERSAADELAAAKAEAAKASEQLRREREDAEAMMRAEAAADRARLGAQIEKAGAEIKSLRELLERERGEAEGAATAAAGEAKERSERLEREIAELKSALQQKEELIAAALAQVREEAERAEREKEKAAGVEDDLRGRERDLRRKLGEREAELEGKSRDFEATVNKLGKEKSEELQNLERQKDVKFRSEMEAELAALRDALTGRLTAERESALAAAEEARRKLGEEAGSIEAGLRAELATARDELKQLREKLAAAGRTADEREAAWSEERSRLDQAARVQEKEGRAAASRDMEKLRGELRGEQEKAMQAAERKHAEELAKLRAQLQETHEAAVAKLRKELQGEAALALESAEKLAAERLEAAASAHAIALEEGLKKAEAERQRDLTSLREEHAAAVAALEGAIKGLRGDLEEQKRKTQSVEQRLSDEMGERANDREAAEREFAVLRQENASALDAVNERREQELARAKSAHDLAVAKLTEQFEMVQQRMKERDVGMQGKLKELEHRYNTRPSREEDVQRINELMDELRQKDKALLKAYDDLRWYKLELVNREESYNKVFGRQPHVQQSRRGPPSAAASADADQRQGNAWDSVRRNSGEPLKATHGMAIPSVTAMGGAAIEPDEMPLRRAATGSGSLGR